MVVSSIMMMMALNASLEVARGLPLNSDAATVPLKEVATSVDGRDTEAICTAFNGSADLVVVLQNDPSLTALEFKTVTHIENSVMKNTRHSW